MAAGARYAATITAAQSQLRAAGFDEAAIDANIADAPLSRIADLATAQPEHALTPGQYVARLVTDDRTTAGRGHVQDFRADLDGIRRTFGVPAEICVAIWGIESRYGAAQGTWPIVSALATLAAIDDRRRPFWRTELEAAVEVLVSLGDRGRILTGSWAGASGHVQFMPTSWQRFAVDVDGDGVADIWASPVDALASAANFLMAHGWRAGATTLIPVQAAPDFDWATCGEKAMSRGAWAMAGIDVACVGDQWSVDETEDLRVLAPEGACGPLFLVGANFASLLAYNNARPYALAVSLLAARIAGHDVGQLAWRPGDHALSHEEKVQLQVQLANLGWDTGGVDGIFGSKSRAAVREVQTRLGRSPDGYADRDFQQALAAAPVALATL
jgi:membrane-bound lytic murein transglycosylase B